MIAKKHILSVGIEDCRVDTFTVGGHGGSGKDTSNTGVRVVHVESGATGHATEHRSQSKNKEIAFRRMAHTHQFRVWATEETLRRIGQPTLDERVEAALHPDRIKVEFLTPDGWIDAKSVEQKRSEDS